MNAPRKTLMSLPVGATLKRLARALAVAGGILAGLLLLLWAWLAWYLLPNLGTYKPQLEQELSAALGHAVHIGSLTGSLQGPVLTLALHQVEIDNPNPGGYPLQLAELSARPSWKSLISWSPRFTRITLTAPELSLRRARDGHLYLNGIVLDGSRSSDSQMLDWLLEQDEIRIEQARLRWRDEAMGLAELDLTQGNLSLVQGLFGHRLTLTAHAPEGWLDAFRFQMTWRGDRLENWRTWRGKFALDVGGANLADWRRTLAWLAHMPAGQGGARVEASFADGQFTSGQARFDLKNVVLRPEAAGPLVAVPNLSGEVELKPGADGGSELLARNLVAQTIDGKLFDQAEFRARWREGAKAGGSLSLSRADLGALRPLLRVLPLGENAAWRALDPDGFVEEVTADWQGSLAAPGRYAVKGRFSGLGWQPVKLLPGISGISGELDFSERGGMLRLSDPDGATLTMPSVFARPIEVRKLDAAVRWTRQPKGVVDVELEKVDLKNADLEARVQGRYRWAPDESAAGLIDLTATIPKVAATAVPAYLPLVVGDDTRAWLAGALKAGQAENAQLKLSGNLDRFPFTDGGGEFLVTAATRNVSLEYGEGWPWITHINGLLEFRNAGMLVKATDARSMNAAIGPTTVSIADLGADHPHLLVDGGAKGASADFVRFMQQSPLNTMLDGFPQGLKAQGNGQLSLRLDIPLTDVKAIAVAGQYAFLDNTLELGHGIPALQQVRGRLAFSERGVSARGIAFQALGGYGRLDADTQPSGLMRFVVNGRADARAALAEYVPPLVPNVGGMTPFRLVIDVNRQLKSLQLDSTLHGVTSDLPVPFAKRADASWPLRLTINPSGTQSRLTLRLGQEVRAQFYLKDSGALARGAVWVAQGRGNLPRQGLAIYVASPSIDAAPWLALLGRDGGGAMPDVPLTLNLQADQVSIDGRLLHAVKVNLEPRSSGWSARVDARELNGTVSLGEQGRVQMRLASLSLPLARQDEGDVPVAANSNESLPSLDVQIDRLTWKDRSMGKLTLMSTRQKNEWKLDRFQLSNSDGQINLRGVQRTQDGQMRSQLNVQLDSASLGKLLARFGEADLVRGGKFRSTGQLEWQGGMTSIQWPSLSGEITLSAESGQFTRAEPGVGRLLGLTTLQSLGRRLRFDFKDVFGEGFAFDSINGAIGLDNGMATLNDFVVRGPAATITLTGKANLVRETQNLTARVLPSLSEGVAIAAGAATLNPLVGAAALAAQKLLQDPLGKLFASEYRITGTFASPKIDSVSRTAPADREKNR
ncbi:YhdP family protein [Laribacter hongkongensis]|uniref:YhdP family protein n=1 Tax=Laribacter hongkongensis TaxID=168471 RepID=UPI001EFE28AE|nr:YhdP family protein [Laribacter hongkongensis]MCG9081616.1 TIGR02099 family protein [Laribacter hongkongensis]